MRFEYGEENCDYYLVLGRFQLHIWKPDPWHEKWWWLKRKEWGIGREVGDGAVAIAMPWFLLYLE